jgi:hypothetical protein
MARSDQTYLSNLEQEFELEMEHEEGQGEQHTGDGDGEADWELESPGNEESEEESQEEPEAEAPEGGDFAERLRELSQREFETEAQLDEEVREIVDEMEREYFFKKWANRLKSVGGPLVKAGLGRLAGQFPAFKGLQAVTQLARGNLKGALGSLAKSGLTAALGAHPLGAVALPALKGLGFETSQDPEQQREAWENYVAVAQEAFDHLGQNIGAAAVDPLGASRLASTAFQTGLSKVQARVGSGAGGRAPSRGRRRVIRVRRGDKIVIVVD